MKWKSKTNMKCPVDARCMVCPKSFCCSNCRWNHEKLVHKLKLNCPLCRGLKFLCHPDLFRDLPLINHIATDHLPLHCSKCEQVFLKMDDLVFADKCTSVSELITKDLIPANDESKTLEEKFESIYEKNVENLQTHGNNIEVILSVDKSNKTAVITPMIRKKYLVDYESSDTESGDSINRISVHTPHPKREKTPKLKRASTPHIKKFLMRQKAFEDESESDYIINNGDVDEIVGNDENATPSREKEILFSEATKELSTPTSHLPNDRFSKIASAVTTSTPTHPVAGNWSLFPEQAGDSPLSEIEGINGDSPAQSIDNERSKTETSENNVPKLKSIIATGSKTRVDGQDSSEKQVIFQDSSNNTDGSNKVKRVKFADDTIFKQENKISRVFRKPKRMLTPGPQKPNKFCYNPRFQALINRFESHGRTLARTPVNVKDKTQENETPPAGDVIQSIQGRAINFKDESDIIAKASNKNNTTSNELYKSCIDSSPVITNKGVNSSIANFTPAGFAAGLAGSIQTCINSALQTTGEETEIQFKFRVTKRKMCVKQILDDGKYVEEKSSEVERVTECNKENIWSSVARAVKNVLWRDTQTQSSYATTTPLTRSRDSFESNTSSGSKRKFETISETDISPINHKRYKYEGRIRGRPSIHRHRNPQVANLKVSYSAEQRSLIKELSSSKEDTQNQSF